MWRNCDGMSLYFHFFSPFTRFPSSGASRYPHTLLWYQYPHNSDSTSTDWHSRDVCPILFSLSLFVILICGLIAFGSPERDSTLFILLTFRLVFCSGLPCEIPNCLHASIWLESGSPLRDSKVVWVSLVLRSTRTDSKTYISWVLDTLVDPTHHYDWAASDRPSSMLFIQFLIYIFPPLIYVRVSLWDSKVVY